MIWNKAVAVRRSLEAGSSSKPDGSALIVEDNQALGRQAWQGTQAKAEPNSALRDHQVVFAIRSCVCQKLKFWRNWNWGRDIGDSQYDYIWSFHW